MLYDFWRLVTKTFDAIESRASVVRHHFLYMLSSMMSRYHHPYKRSDYGPALNPEGIRLQQCRDANRARFQ
ncbi:hypothetical protein WCLP8_1100028 [uncultured Gammaproteobacteria bacterium]